MTTLFSRILSPTVLLYSFVVITQFAHGIYLGQQIDPPGGFALLSWLGLLWIIGWWLRTDSRKRRVASIYDMGLFLFIAWPLVLPYYLVKTRGAKGLVAVVAFLGAYMGAAIVGSIVSVLVSSAGL
jgi:hypothetical protein